MSTIFSSCKIGERDARYVKIFTKFPEHLNLIPQSRVLLEKLLAPHAHNKNSLNFMKPESSLPCSEHSHKIPPLVSPSSQLISNNVLILFFFKFHFTIIVPSMLMSSVLSIYFRCPTESQFVFTFSSIHEACSARFIF